MKPTESLHQALKITRLAEGFIQSEELSKQYLDTVKKDTQINGISKSPSSTRVRVLEMVNNITQAVVNKNTEGTVTTVGLNTHPGDALPMARNAITARKRDISPNVAVQELVHSLHSISLERNSMI